MEPDALTIPHATIEKGRQQIAERPRVQFVFERDWISGPHTFAVGALWNRDFEATPGMSAYKRAFILRLKFRLWLDRR